MPSPADDENKDNNKDKDAKRTNKNKANKNQQDQKSEPKKKKSPAKADSEDSPTARSARRVEKPKVTVASLSITRVGSQPTSCKVSSSASRSSSQARRVDSDSSMSSMGIGGSQVAKNQANENALPKLVPEGNVPEGHTVYDCIVYLFYCPTHDRFALTNVDKCKVVWFPFVVMRPGITNTQAAVEEMSLFLGRRDAEADGEQTFVKMPKFSANQFVHVMHVRLPSGRSYHRFAYFVQIDPTDGYQCCQPTARLTWHQTNDILQDQVESLWGPEVKQFITMLIQPEPVYMEEFNRESALFLLTNHERASMYQSQMLVTCKISQDTVLELFEDYVEHCFPSTFMSFESFKCYLIKYGFSRTDPRFMWLFNAIGYNRKGYLDFNEFLIGIVSFEPDTQHNTEGRFRLIFRYYDVDRDDNLSVDELLCLLRDINMKASAEVLREQVEHLRSHSMKNDLLSYEAYHKAVQGNRLQSTGPLCRAPKAIIPKVLANKAKRNRNSNSYKVPTNKKSSVKGKSKGVCSGCRSQNIDYCVHIITLDAAAMCQKPMRLKDVPVTDTITPNRYSVEFVFPVESMPRMFIDTIRTIYQQEVRVGLMCTPEDAPSFAGYVQGLTENVCELLSAEERLVRMNAPTVVIGDILGNFDSLMAMERTLWQSIPILSANLVFLGNYSGPSSRFNVEVLCYLLALKMLAPNKVILLRGSNEIRAENKATLLLECEQRYGGEFGRAIWNCLNEALDRLPVAVIIDESIMCVHSGVPKTKCLLSTLYSIHGLIQNVQKESPLAFELIFNVPVQEDRSQSESIDSTGSGRSISTEFNMTNFSTFMRLNSLTHMIRSNESLVEGYRLQYGTRIVTISSAIEPTVAFVDGTSGMPSIRLMQVPLKRESQSTGRMTTTPLAPTK